jgi:hypothetical protein
MNSEQFSLLQAENIRLRSENALLASENRKLRIDLNKLLDALKSVWESLPFVLQLVSLFKGKFTWLKVLGNLGKIAALLNAIIGKFKDGKELAGDLAQLSSIPGTSDTL